MYTVNLRKKEIPKKQFYFPAATAFQTGSSDPVLLCTHIPPTVTTTDGGGQVTARGVKLVQLLLFQSHKRCVLSVISHSPALVLVAAH